MFDEIYALCQAEGLKMSVWVDDLNISGAFVRGDLVDKIRAIIRRRGFHTHKIKFRTASRPVIITGVPIEKRRVTAPRSLHQRVQNGYEELRGDLSDIARGQTIDRLLSALGTYRYHVGASTPEGRVASNRMHALRQRRRKLDMTLVTLPTVLSTGSETDEASPSDTPW